MLFGLYQSLLERERIRLKFRSKSRGILGGESIIWSIWSWKIQHLLLPITDAIIDSALGSANVSSTSVVRRGSMARWSHSFWVFSCIHGLVGCAEVTCFELLTAGGTNDRKGEQLQSPVFEILMNRNVPKLSTLGFLGGVPCCYPGPSGLCRGIVFRIFSTWWYKRLENGTPSVSRFRDFHKT